MDCKIIPIVYAADQEYMKFVLVSMVSALQYAKSNSFYKFYVLIPKNCRIDTIRINNRLSRFDNYSLSFIRMGNEFSDVKLFIDHTTTPTFFRLKIPSLLREYDKCIYIDGDTIVCEDLQGLFDTDIKDNYLAGVQAYCYLKNAEQHINRLDFNIKDKSRFQYINAGVLLMNLKKLRNDNIEERFMQLLAKEYECQDQDILNIACYGKIRLLPFKYNVMTKYINKKADYFPNSESLLDIKFGIKHPVIVHYADKEKPWNKRSVPYSNLWYAVAMTDICIDLFSDNKYIKKMFYGWDVSFERQYEKLKPKLYDVKKILRAGIHCLSKHGPAYTIYQIIASLKH